MIEVAFGDVLASCLRSIMRAKSILGGIA
ncbi:hypothetical protein KT99_06657 [Shewanella benthica KT99]|uniref:Uncharacterized protein n=1 Tax=Shewanella benthica KT99 TaxID=314608 RepID=A9CVC7_9GAMM|nr:hypothetical protein KT99_06657 [Shewanella benthica KT99]